MSNDKPCAVATIKFYANKHVDVQLTDIRNITPRTLDIASNILLKTYKGMKAAFNAEEHRAARKKRDKEIKDAKQNSENFHKSEDERLENLAAEALKGMPSGSDSKSEAKVEIEIEVETEETETNTGDDPVITN